MNTEETNPFMILANWDLQGPRTRLVRELSIDDRYLDGMEKEYKRFIALTIVYPKKRFSISREIDELWHAHVLYTRDYAKMCKSVAGGFLHHDPVEGPEVTQEARHSYFENTLPCYEDLFGIPDERYWPRDSEGLHCSLCGPDGSLMPIDPEKAKELVLVL